MHSMLLRTVERGSGHLAKVAGVTLGGKTGTARIAIKGTYSNHYNDTFIGYVQDKAGHSYLIGTLVIDPPQGKHLASQTAAPLARQIVQAMVERHLLTRSASSVTIKTMQIQTRTLEHLQRTLLTPQMDANTTQIPEPLIPLRSPQIVRAFGMYRDPEYGITIDNTSVTLRSMESIPDVRCVYDGTILFVGRRKGLEYTVVVRHSDRLYTVYSHLDHVTSGLTVGQDIQRGSVLGQIKDTLIFQIIYDGQPIDPTDWIEEGR